MAALEYVTPEEFFALLRRVEDLEQRLQIYIDSTDDDVSTKLALQITGIKSRSTLIKEREQPGSLLKYSKHGRFVSYSRSSCVDYKLSKRLRYRD